MTAEAFIKEKLIPWIESQASQVEEEGRQLAGLDKAILAGVYTGFNGVTEFIEQHRTEWEGE